MRRRSTPCDEPRPHGITKRSGVDDLDQIRVGSYRIIDTIRVRGPLSNGWSRQESWLMSGDNRTTIHIGGHGWLVSRNDSALVDIFARQVLLQ